MQTCFRLIGPDIVFEDFDGDLVVLNLSTGQYFGFNGTANVVFEALIAAVSFDDITKNCASVTNLSNFLSQVQEFGLVTKSTAPKALSDELSKKLQSCNGLATVDRYDDLADLIVADPIHDTNNEQGWPVVEQKTSNL